MSMPVSLTGALFVPPRPVAICRSDRSSMSRHASKGYTCGSHAGHLSALYGIVGKCGEQVVGRSNGMSIAGKVNVHLVLGLDARLAAAGASTLNTENGAERRLSQRGDNVDPELPHALSEPYRGGSLALSRGRRSHSGDYDQFAAATVAAHRVQRDLGLIVAIGDEHLGVETKGLWQSRLLVARGSNPSKSCRPS